jgi:hypothetical protein
MLRELFFGEESIYDAISREEGDSAGLLAHEIAEASAKVHAELSEDGKRAWDEMREKGAEQDAQRLYRAFQAGIRLTLSLMQELLHDGETPC